MNIRLISGALKNHKITAPNSRQTHPMSERIRGAVFNSIQAYVPNARVLDAFAGTGALGLEALSRGASSVIFIEKNRLAQKILAENLKIIERTDLNSSANLIRAGISGWLNSTSKQFALGEIPNLPTFNLIFADPPYYDPQFPVIERLVDRLEADGILVLSQPASLNDFSHPQLLRLNAKTYSAARIIIFKKYK